jgi:hypothetical protein
MCPFGLSPSQGEHASELVRSPPDPLGTRRSIWREPAGTRRRRPTFASELRGDCDPVLKFRGTESSSLARRGSNRNGNPGGSTFLVEGMRCVREDSEVAALANQPLTSVNQRPPAPKAKEPTQLGAAGDRCPSFSLGNLQFGATAGNREPLPIVSQLSANG